MNHIINSQIFPLTAHRSLFLFLWHMVQFHHSSPNKGVCSQQTDHIKAKRRINTIIPLIRQMIPNVVSFWYFLPSRGQTNIIAIALSEFHGSLTPPTCRCGCVGAAWKCCLAPGWLTSPGWRNPTTATSPSTRGATLCAWPRSGWTNTSPTSTWPGTSRWRWLFIVLVIDQKPEQNGYWLFSNTKALIL